MVEKNQTPIESALLTATLKLLQVSEHMDQKLTALKTDQDQGLKQGQTLQSALQQVQQTQEHTNTTLQQNHQAQTTLLNQNHQAQTALLNHNHQATLKAVAALPDIVERLNGLTAQIKSLDVRQTLIEQTKLINDLKAEQTQALQTLTGHLDNKIAASDQTLLAQIEKGDSAHNRAVIGRLIEGLKNMNDKTITVAKRIENLGHAVQGLGNDTQILSDNVANSSSRLESVDMRMGMMFNNENADVSDLSGATDLLTKLAAQDGITAPKIKAAEVHDRIEQHTKPLDDQPELTDNTTELLKHAQDQNKSNDVPVYNGQVVESASSKASNKSTSTTKSSSASVVKKSPAESTPPSTADVSFEQMDLQDAKNVLRQFEHHDDHLIDIPNGGGDQHV